VCCGLDSHGNEHSNKPPGSITGGEFLGQLSDYQFPNENSVPWK
jgi:hypothetical protein